MKKILLLLIAAVTMLLCACSGGFYGEGTACSELSAITERFGLDDAGVIYSDDENAGYVLTQSMLSSMFSGNENKFRYAVSCAAYFSRRFSDGEIVVIQVSDRSRREEIYGMCLRRAAKKHNAIVYADGNFVYLICTDINSEIAGYIRKR